MTAPTIKPVSYSYDTAAAATGYSVDVIRRAVRAGDLEMVYPRVDGRTLSKGTIPAQSLDRWVETGRLDRAS